MFGMDNESLLAWSSWIMILTGLLTFLSLTFINAPYGRYSTDKGWGFLMPAKLAWFIMESPNLWITALIYLWSPDATINNSNRMLLTCFLTHYVNRAIIFPIGMSDCSPMPVSVMLMAFIFCSWNGFNQAVSLLLVNKYESDWILDQRFIVGIALFYIGFFTNMRADNSLIKLRREAQMEADEVATSTDAPVTKKYVIPTGGLFEYVSCANYLGEIVEWIGFAIACWSLPALAFALYTIANLAPRAIKHHNWYKQKFPHYPKDRKALIPFVI